MSNLISFPGSTQLLGCITSEGQLGENGGEGWERGGRGEEEGPGWEQG